MKKNILKRMILVLGYSFSKLIKVLVLAFALVTIDVSANPIDTSFIEIDSIFSKFDSIYLNVFPDDSISITSIKSLNSIVIYSNYKSCIDCKRELVETLKKRKFKRYTIFVLIDEYSNILALRTEYNEWKQLFGDRKFIFLCPMRNQIIIKSNKNSPSIDVFKNSKKTIINYEELFDINGKVIIKIP